MQRRDFLDLLPSGWGTTLRETYARQLRYALVGFLTVARTDVAPSDA
ncbi:MAG: hypothetical protein QOC94_4582 [Actinoplanes sp.]|nr:hypothetical protein [Actinoplanes sp.]